jgi:hypothetical protein
VSKELVDKEKQELAPNRLQKVAAILLLSVVAFVAIDGFFNNWGTMRGLLNLNALELRDENNGTWKLFARDDFKLIGIKNVQNLLIPDSLIAIDRPFRDAGYYRLYFRVSDSVSPKLQKMYQALLSADTGQTIKRTITDAQRAYQNLRLLLRINPASPRDSVSHLTSDSTSKFLKNDLTLGSGEEAASVLKKIVSNPEVLIGMGVGIVASAAIELLKGNAYLAVARNDVFRLDSLNVGTRAGKWEDAPIDILWVFAKEDTTRMVKE